MIWAGAPAFHTSSASGSSRGLFCHIHTSIPSHPTRARARMIPVHGVQERGWRSECVCGERSHEELFAWQLWPFPQRSSQEETQAFQSQVFFPQEELDPLRSCRHRKAPWNSRELWFPLALPPAAGLGTTAGLPQVCDSLCGGWSQSTRRNCRCLKEAPAQN